ncbi:MAG: Lsr2 [Frankiales bacterium]|nr:Lsr2 [Frankiales bacterium]
MVTDRPIRGQAPKLRLHKTTAGSAATEPAPADAAAGARPKRTTAGVPAGEAQGGAEAAAAGAKSIRAWATSHGIKISTRGRIPNDIVKQFRAANAD